MMKYLATLLLTLLFHAAQAHDPDQIGYHFRLNKEIPTLKVHFTPKSALDLIMYLKPELKDQEAIRLADYGADYEQYFSETVNLYVGGSAISFKLVESDLLQHDATLTFHLSGIPREVQGFQVVVTSFTEIYQRTINKVTIESIEATTSFALDSYLYTEDQPDFQLYAGEIKATEASLRAIWPFYMLFLVFGAIWTWKKLSSYPR